MNEIILLVDDEESILNSLVRLFSEEDYRIFTATSGMHGLKIVEKNDVSLVISDHRMPEMTGVEFLEKVKEASPDTMRIMLTGYADLEASIAAINKGEVYRFITKPWNDEELLLTVRQSLEYRNLTLSNRKLTRTVKSQSMLLKKLESTYPGISRVTREEDGAIVVNEEELEDTSLDKLIAGMK